MSSARWLAAQYAEGAALAREALALAGDDAEIRIFATLYIGIHSFFVGRFDEAIGCFLRIVEGPDVVAARRRFGSAGPAYVVAGYFLVWARATVGEFDRALEHGRRAVDAVDTGETPPYQAPVYNFLALALSARGEHADAVRHAEAAVRLAESQRILSWLPATSSTLGAALVAAGRPEDGLPFLERSVIAHEGLGIQCFLSLFVNRWAEGLHAVGRRDEAEVMARRAADLARQAGERAVEAEAFLLLGAIAETGAPGEPTRADDLYSAAIVVADELGMRPLAAQARLRRAALWGRHGEAARAAGDVAVAARLFEAMAMRGGRARADALAASSRP
jgi:tetratricopeptide (TPR) repeat protein